MGKHVNFERYTVSVPKGLPKMFAAKCRERGRSQSWVMAGFMRRYVGAAAREPIERESVRRRKRAEQKELPGLAVAEKSRT